MPQPRGVWVVRRGAIPDLPPGTDCGGLRGLCDFLLGTRRVVRKDYGAQCTTAAPVPHRGP